MDRGRKISGGKYHKLRKTKKFERKGQDRRPSLGELRKKSIRGFGGKIKMVILKANLVNVVDGKKTKKAKIINVEETPQNRFLARQNRLIKGALIETSIGKARITNRPSQEGHVNAILLKKE